jgi:hypothetical protein
VADAIRFQDEAGRTVRWQTPQGERAFVLDFEQGCLRIEAPAGSARTNAVTIDLAAFREGIGQASVNQLFGPDVIREILDEIARAGA